MTEKNKIKGYDKLSPQRQLLVEKVIDNMEKGNLMWQQGWKSTGSPESATTGKPYRGINNFYLSLIGMTEGYSDNRWATYHQMEENGWTFKTTEEGKSLAKGKGCPVEFYELRDRETKKPFRRDVLVGMTKEEQDEYIEKNVYPIRKFYRVFNADLIEGIPEKVVDPIDERNKSMRVENFIKFWSDTESPVKYGGDSSFYSVKFDEIHLPERSKFNSAEQYYSTALHEIGHSTGHESRLNRKIDNKFGSEDYAIEELRAEIASLFMEQDFNVSVDDKAIRNNSAYLQSWLDEIKENPDVLFKAIADADKIAKYVRQKEESKKKRVEYYSVETAENEAGDQVYKVYMIAENGETALDINTDFLNKESLFEEFNKLQETENYIDAEFREVPFEQLKALSIEKAQNTENKTFNSKEYVRPDNIVAMATGSNIAVNMTGKGIESLQRMSDREVIEKARNVENGDIFERLYNGQRVFSSEEKDEEFLMARLSIYCDNDKDRLLRVYQSSGQYKDNKPNSYYMKIAESMLDKAKVVNTENKGNAPIKKSKGRFGANSK